MDLKELSFGVFGLAAVIEIAVLVLVVQVGVRSRALFYVTGAAALVALGALGIYTLAAWRSPTSDHEAHAAH
ncbi:MAG: hypothetical protein ABEJ80_07810 [Halarchaeum sp.]